MAAFSTGITVTWRGTPFQEDVALSWSYGGSHKGRSERWTDEAGTLTLTCLGAANTGFGEYGQRGSLVVSGGGQSLTNTAVWDSINVTSELNGVTRYTVTFNLLDN